MLYSCMPVTRSQKRTRDHEQVNAFIEKQRTKNPGTVYSGAKGHPTWRSSSGRGRPSNAPCLQRVRYKEVPVTKSTPQLPTWFEQLRSRSNRVAGGVFGMVYEVSRSDANTMLQTIRKLPKDGGYAQYARLVPDHKRVAMKVSEIEVQGDDSATAYQEIQAMLALKGLRVVPTLYGTARFVDRTREKKNGYARVYCVILMSLVDGNQLQSVIRWGLQNHWLKHPYDMQKVRRNLNSALIQLWKRGVLHTDLHTSNVLVTRENKVYIVDFGFAMQSPWLKKLASRFSTTENAVFLWKTYIEPSANVAVMRNGRRVYSPDGKVLAFLRSGQFNPPQLRNINVPPTALIKRFLNRVRKRNPEMSEKDLTELVNAWVPVPDGLYPPLRPQLVNKVMRKYRQ